MISVVVVGFPLKSLEGFPGVAWAHHDSSTSSSLSTREYLLMIDRVILQADALLVNLEAESFTPNEVIILHTSYIHKTPVLGTGYKRWEPVIEEMVSKRVIDLTAAVEHIQSNYTLFSG